MKKILLLITILLCVCGCSSNKSMAEIMAEKITYEEAKEKIATGAILFDVRTKEEYEEKHIEGAISFPYNTIAENTITQYVDNKDDVIIVYCMSGGRSKEAGKKLKSLGYKNVYDLGSINNWKE